MWRIWCAGRACSRPAGARRRAAGPTACTGCCRTRSRPEEAPRVRTDWCWRSFRSRPDANGLCFGQVTCWGPMGWKCSATPSTAASAPCRGASWSGPGPRACRTPTCWPWGASELCPTPGWCTAGTRSATRLWRAAQSSPGSSVSPDPSCPDSHQRSVCFKAVIAFGPAGCPSLSLRGRPRKRRGQDDRDSPTTNQSESWIERMKVGFYSPEAVFPGGSGLTSPSPSGERDGQRGGWMRGRLAPSPRRAALPGSALRLHGPAGLPHPQSPSPGLQKE